MITKKDNYELAREFELLASEIIDEFPEEFSHIEANGIRIGYIKSDKRKKGRDKIVFADTRNVSDIYKVFCPYDFLITFYMPHVAMLNEQQRRILMRHELRHVGVDGKGMPYVVPHDIEDFTEILEEHGLHWAKLW